MTHTDDPLRLGATVGILGSGQLGRMLAIAAAQLGFKTHIYSDVSGPAFDVASRTTTASFDDAGQVATFAEQVDVVTYEFENVPLAAADAALAGAPVRPGRRALEVAQHRLTEKTFLRDLGCNVPQFFGVQSAHDLADALPKLGGRAVLKTCRFGYDGKGQARLTATSDAAEALGSIGGPPAIVEAHVDFDFEVSVVLARSANGDVVHYDPSRNVHIDGILSTSTVPSGLLLQESHSAVELASTIAKALDYVGVLAVEFFVCKTSAPGETQFLVNEIAPRVHNSGHWTMDACSVSQFENHIRAIAGWPLGATERHHDAVMTNLLGPDIHQVARLLGTGGVAAHVYGKNDARPGRKMGHINTLTPLSRRSSSR